jgi:hypothetical protein
VNPAEIRHIPFRKTRACRPGFLVLRQPSTSASLGQIDSGGGAFATLDQRRDGDYLDKDARYARTDEYVPWRARSAAERIRWTSWTIPRSPYGSRFSFSASAWSGFGRNAASPHAS